MSIVKILIIIAVFIVGFITIRIVFNWLLIKASKTKILVDDRLLLSLRPSLYFIWLSFGLGWLIYSLAPILGLTITSSASKTIIFIIGVITINIFLLLFINLSASNNQNSKFDQSLVKSLSNVAKLLIIIISALVILQNLGINTSGLLALGSVGGLTIGFASKDLLSNIFGGLAIYLDKPFKTGDWIKSPDREIEGTVEAISWRRTIIRTFNKRPLYIPNSLFLSLIIENPSRMNNRRIYETIGMRYQDADKLAVIIETIKSYLIAHSEIDTTQTLMVNFNKFADSSLDIFIYCFCKTTDWEEYHHIKDQVLQQIYDIIKLNNADIAFPTTTLNLPTTIDLKK